MATEIETAVLMQKIADDIEHIKKRSEETLTQVKYTNGKVKDLTIWRAKIDGGKKALGWAWGFLSIFVVAGLFGLFNMYMDFQAIKNTLDDIDATNRHFIETTVDKVVSSYFEEE